MPDPTRIETHYLAAKDSLVGLLRSLPSEQLHVPVPACPGWSVGDVVRHLVGTPEDAAAGKLSGIPTDEQTAEQIAVRADRDLDDLVAAWDALAPGFAATVAELGIWPAAIDVVTHEHDIRHAVDRPGDRDGEAIRDLAEAVGAFRLSPDVRVETPTRSIGADDAPVTLRTTDFELLRIRMGRRSRSQLEGLDWQGDPSAVIDELCVFGPSPVDIDE